MRYYYSYARRPPLLLTAAILIAASFAAPASTPPPKKPKASGSSSSSSILLPVQGSVHPDGLYRVTMAIGLPPKPYFLDIDTGSDLTWLHCDAPCRKCPTCPHPLYRPVGNKLITCKDPLCDPPGSRDCNADPDQCDYDISYVDGGSSMGVLVTDAFTFRLANGSIISQLLAFGCGYDQQGGSFGNTSAVDGVLGIGCGAARSTFLSQLEDTGITNRVVGHCLGRKGVGYLFFGDAYIPTSGVSWAPISCTSRGENKYYSPGQATVVFDEKPVGVIRAVVFDSGSSYTYFANQPYQEFLSAVKNDVSNKLKEISDPALPTCWEGPFKTLSLRSIFKPVFLVFSNKAQFVVPPENYLIETEQGNVCLGILDGTEAGLKDISLIGDISMQDLTVIYDNEKLQIGWAPTSCDDRIPKSGT